MIQDVLEMPFAITKKDVTFKNIIPTIVYDGHHCNEEWYWSGREIELSKVTIKNTYRYKIIEYVGSDIVERVILTDKPIDVNSDWSKCEDTHVFPLYAIIRHSAPQHHDVCFERYLPGIHNALSWFDCFPDNLQTVHSFISNRLNDWYHPGTIRGSLMPTDIHHNLITGSMSNNFEQYATVIHATDINAWCSDNDLKTLNKHPEKLTHKKDKLHQAEKTYISYDLRLSHLNFLKSASSGLWCVNQTSGKPNRLFDPNDDSVEHNAPEYKTLYQMKFIEYFADKTITDIYIKAKVCKRERFGSIRREISQIEKFDMLNRYHGWHRDMTNMTSSDNMLCHEIFHLLEEAYGDLICEMEVLKNWWDEIYVRFVDDHGNEHKFFYDLTWLVLADPSIVDVVD